MTNAWIAELAKGLTAGTQAYQSADQDRKARAKQDFEMGVTLLDPDMATSAFAEMQAPDPVSRWLGSAMGQKPPDTSKMQGSLKSYLAMKRQEMEDERRARLVKAAGLGDAPVQFDDPAMPAMPTAPPAPVPSLPPTTDQPLPIPPMAPPVPVPSSPMGPPVDAMEPPPTVTPWADTLGPRLDPGLAAPADMTPPLSPVSGGFPQTPAPELAANPFEAPEETPKNYVLPGVTVGNPMGLIEPGNIDLTSFGAIKSPKGNISTVDSFAFKDGDRYVLLPLAANGETIQKEEAVGNYFRDGKKNLGTFATPEAAEDYRVKLHEQQATAYGQPPQAPAPAPPAPVAPPVAAAPAPAAPPAPATPEAEPEILRPAGPKIPVPGIAGGWLPAVTDGNIEMVQNLERRKGKPLTTDFRTMSNHAAKAYLKELDSYPDRYATHFFADAAGRQYRAIEDKVTGESTSTVLSSAVPVDKRGVPVNSPAGTLKYDKKTNTFSQMVEDLDRTGIPTKPAYRHTEAAIGLPPKQETRGDGIYNVVYAKQDPQVELKATRVANAPKPAETPMISVGTGRPGEIQRVPASSAGRFPMPRAIPQPPPPKPYSLEQAKKDATIETEAALGYPRPRDSILEGVKQKRWDREYQKQLQKKRAEKHVAAPKPLSAEARQLAETIGFDLTGMA